MKGNFSSKSSAVYLFAFSLFFSAYYVFSQVEEGGLENPQDMELVVPVFPEISASSRARAMQILKDTGVVFEGGKFVATPE
jgi:hypothetical protein